MSLTKATKVLAIGVPKAGTNLLVRVLELAGLEYTGWIEPNAPPRIEEIEPGRGILSGIERPHVVDLEELKESLTGIKEGRFGAMHLQYSPKAAKLLRELALKMVLIIRDPRDIVVSDVHYVMRRPEHWLHQLYSDSKDKIMVSMKGDKEIGLASIRERFLSILEWEKDPLCHITRFEELVGPKGGGDKEAQKKEIEKILLHVGVDAGEKEIAEIAEKAFSPSSRTFRKGKIGTWRKEFTKEHKEEFKRLAGELVIALRYEDDLEW